jgi:hypothetical protein
MKPTEEHEAAWQAFAKVMRFNSEAVKYLQISELDEFPKPDKRGRKMIDGWKINWEGKIPPGRSDCPFIRLEADLQSGIMGMEACTGRSQLGSLTCELLKLPENKLMSTVAPRQLSCYIRRMTSGDLL